MKEVKTIEQQQKMKRKKVAETMLRAYTEEEVEDTEVAPEKVSLFKALYRKIAGCLKSVVNKLMRRST